jgi:hypothetical protein
MATVPKIGPVAAGASLSHGVNVRLPAVNDYASNDLIGKEIRMSDNSISGESDPGKASERRPNTLTIADRKPSHLYWPRKNQDVTLERRQALFIHLPLPKGEFRSAKLRKQWTVNVVDMNAHTGLKLWIQANKIVEPANSGIVYQEMEIRPITPRGIKPGKHLMGAVRLTCDQETIMLNVYLEVGEDDPRESLRWHLDYWRCARNSRPITTGGLFEQHHSQTKNRTTLIDPVGKMVDIPVQTTHDVEIILHQPCYGNAEGEWDVCPRVLGGGEVEVLDHSIYRTWSSDDRIHRVLLRAHRTDKTFFTEIKIKRNGEDTETRICLYGVRPTDKSLIAGVGQEVEEPQGRVQLVGNPGERNKIRIEDWRTGQHVILFPYEYVHVAVPVRTDLLDPRHQHLEEQSRWDVELVEVAIEEEVWQALPLDVREEVDRLAPYYQDQVVFHPGNQPWKDRELILPPLDASQPFIYDIQDAMERVYGVQPSYPLADLKFSVEVDKRFVITQELHLHLGSYRAMRPEGNHTKIFSNPQDHSKICIQDREVISIRLPFKYRCNQRTGENEHRASWSCASTPTWLVRLNYEERKEDNIQVFNFMCDLPPQFAIITGKVLFTNSGAGNLQKRITVQGTKVRDK